MIEVVLSSSARTSATDSQLLADSALVAAFKAGDMAAFSALFGRYQSPVLGYVYQMVGDLSTAEDLTQDIFIKLFLQLKRTPPDLDFHPWLFRIAANRCIDLLRSRKRHSAVAPSSSMEIESAGSTLRIGGWISEWFGNV